MSHLFGKSPSGKPPFEKKDWGDSKLPSFVISATVNNPSSTR